MTTTEKLIYELAMREAILRNGVARWNAMSGADMLAEIVWAKHVLWVNGVIDDSEHDTKFEWENNGGD